MVRKNVFNYSTNYLTTAYFYGNLKEKGLEPNEEAAYLGEMANSLKTVYSL